MRRADETNAFENAVNATRASSALWQNREAERQGRFTTIIASCLAAVNNNTMLSYYRESVMHCNSDD